jgi:hypothetical protein
VASVAVAQMCEDKYVRSTISGGASLTKRIAAERSKLCIPRATVVGTPTERRAPERSTQTSRDLDRVAVLPPRVRHPASQLSVSPSRL